MKKILYMALMVCATIGITSACSNDYEDATSPHEYGETENPPLKGSDANMPSASISLKQAEAGTEVKTVDLADYASQIQEQLGMSLDEAIAGLSNGSTRFLLVNPVRRVWDKAPANQGENKWGVSASGIITNDENSTCATVEFLPASKQLRFTLTNNASAGIIPVVAGFVKTEQSAYPVNFRCQTLLKVTDASVVDVALTVPKGDYANVPFHFESIAKNIEFAFGVTDLYSFAKGLDTSDPVYDVYLMNSSGTLYGGEGKYTANGAGYWLTKSCEIVNWGADGFAIFIEPDIYDWESEDYYKNGGGFVLGRLSNDTPASGDVINLSVVIKPRKSDDNKTLTINFELTYE